MRRRSFLGTRQRRPGARAEAHPARRRWWIAAVGSRLNRAAGEQDWGRRRSPGSSALQSGLKVTGMKVFGVSLTPQLRPALRILQARNQPGPGRLGRGHARRQGRRDDGLHRGLPRVPDRRRPDAGRAHLAIDVRPQLLPRRAGHGLGDLGHRPGAVGHSRQSARHARCTSCWAARSIRAAFAATITPTACARRKRLQKLRETAIQQGVTCFKTGIPGLLRVDRDARRRSQRP